MNADDAPESALRFRPFGAAVIARYYDIVRN